MESNQYISTLVGTGADTFSNLWQLSLTDTKLLTHYARITNVTVPMQDRKIIEVPYMNTRVYKKTPFVDLDKKFTFSIRVDENYGVYKALLDSLNAKTYDMVSSTDKTFTAVLACVTPSDEIVYSVTFKNCSVVSMGKTAQYTYDSSRPMVVPVTVIFESKEEDDNRISSIKVSGSYVSPTATQEYSESATAVANDARWWVNKVPSSPSSSSPSALDIANKAREDYRSRS